jgi:hypothetical protein
VSFAALIPLIHELEDVFDRLQVTRSYGGTIAYNFYAPPRFTQDIDVLLLVPAVTIPSLAEEFSTIGLRAELERPGPLSVEPILQQLRNKPYLCVLYCSAIRTELFTPWHPFHHLVLERSPIRELGGRKIRIHAPEDLIVFKKIFDRPKDIMDIKAILLSQKGTLDFGGLRFSAEMLLTKESLEGFAPNAFGVLVGAELRQALTSKIGRCRRGRR